MRFLDSLFTKTARSNASTGAVRRASSSAVYVPEGVPYNTVWDLDRMVKEGFEQSIWAHRAITAIASNASRLHMHVHKGGPDGDIIENRKLDKVLNRRTNPHETAANFKFRLSCQLLLSKNGAFIEVVRNRMGEVTEMYLLPPDATRVIPDRRTFVAGYEVRTGDGEVAVLEPENVIWIRQPHPVHPYEGTTPLEAAGLSIDLDFYARMYNRNFMQNDGRPGGLIGVKGRLSPLDAKELKDRFGGGVERAGRTTVIEADDVSWVDTATTPRDAQYTELSSQTKNDILLAFGVPESVIGNAANRTFANADAEFDVFWRVTMLPHLDLIAGALEVLTGADDDDDVLVYDTSSISVLQRDKRERDGLALAKFQAGVFSLDEYLEAVGMPTLDVPLSRARWVPTTGKTPIAENDEDVAAAMGIMNGQPPGAEDPAAAAGALGAPGPPAAEMDTSELQASDDPLTSLAADEPADDTDAELLRMLSQ